MTEINRKMNIVVTAESDDGVSYVFSRPLSKEAIRVNKLILGKVFASIVSEGFGALAGPGVAYELLKETAGDRWEGPSGVRNTLVNEIIRNSEAFVPTEEKGWETYPLDVAISRGMIDEDDVLGELIFFTCIWALSKTGPAIVMSKMANGLRDSAFTSLSATEWMRSSLISKTGEPGGGTESTS